MHLPCGPGHPAHVLLAPLLSPAAAPGLAEQIAETAKAALRDDQQDRLVSWACMGPARVTDFGTATSGSSMKSLWAQAGAGLADLGSRAQQATQSAVDAARAQAATKFAVPTLVPRGVLEDRCRDCWDHSPD